MKEKLFIDIESGTDFNTYGGPCTFRKQNNHTAVELDAHGKRVRSWTFRHNEVVLLV